MKEEYEILLVRQSVVEKKIDQIEQQLELVSEVLEKIVEQVQDINETLANSSGTSKLEWTISTE